MRFTPAGIEVFEAVLHHRSEVVEAGKVRKLEFDFNAVSYGALARRLNGMETVSYTHLTLPTSDLV